MASASWGLSDMEIDVIVERLAGIERTLVRIEDQRLKSIEDNLRSLNGRLGKCENWQSATDPVLESMNERVDEVTDVADKNSEWISQQTGWNSARAQMLVQGGTLVGVIIAVIKIIFFHS